MNEDYSKVSKEIFANLVNVVSQVTGLSAEIIFGKSRKAYIVDARRMMCYILREKYKLHWGEIRDLMGFKDHTAAFHHHANHPNYLYEKSYSYIYNLIIEQLNNNESKSKETR
jgi:chromosomal replication initiation ATPase DnaA